MGEETEMQTEDDFTHGVRNAVRRVTIGWSEWCAAVKRGKMKDRPDGKTRNKVSTGRSHWRKPRLKPSGAMQNLTLGRPAGVERCAHSIENRDCSDRGGHAK